VPVTWCGSAELLQPIPTSNVVAAHLILASMPSKFILHKGDSGHMRQPKQHRLRKVDSDHISQPKQHNHTLCE
jgi:hypothetical protein